MHSTACCKTEESSETCCLFALLSKDSDLKCMQVLRDQQLVSIHAHVSARDEYKTLKKTYGSKLGLVIY